MPKLQSFSNLRHAIVTMCCADIVESENFKNVGIGCKTTLSLANAVSFIIFVLFVYFVVLQILVIIKYCYLLIKYGFIFLV